MISRRGLALVAARRQPLLSSPFTFPTGLPAISLLRYRNDGAVLSRFEASSRAWESTATPDPSNPAEQTSAAALSTEPDGDKSGHIAVSTNESILFFESKSPRNVTLLLIIR